MTELSELGEFGLIERLRRALPCRDPQVISGIGDDAAVVRPTPGHTLLATTDLLLEGIHFRLHTISSQDLGRRAMAANLSDIAAMGGSPRFALVALALPANAEVAFVDDLYSGLEGMAEQYGVTIIGGDLSVSEGGVLLALTLLGEVGEGQAVGRGGARVGEKLFVTGTLGDAAIGLDLLEKGETTASSPCTEALLRRHRLPTPRVAEGRLLAANRLASAMIDSSDGLVASLRQLCAASGVGARVHLEQLPLSPEVRELCRQRQEDPYPYALGGGEDFELLFTVLPQAVEELRRCWCDSLTPITCIGEVTAKIEGMILIDPQRGAVELPPGGHDHFAR